MGNLASSVVSITLEAQIAQFQAEMGKAAGLTEQSMQRMQKAADQVKNALGSIASALGVGLSINAFTSMVESTIKAKAELQKMADMTGASANSLSALGAAAKLTETPLESVVSAINKMQKGLAGSNEDSRGAAAAIKALGLNFDEFKKLDPAAEMLAIAKAQDKFQDGMGKSAAMQAIFGKTGAANIPMLKDLAEKEELVGKTSNEAAAQAEAYEKNMIRLKKAGEGWKSTMVDSMLPALVAVTEDMTRANKEGGKWAMIQAGIQTWFTGNDQHKNDKAIVDQTELMLSLEKSIAVYRSQGFKDDFPLLAARIKALAEVNAQIKTTLTYRKLLQGVDDEEERKKKEKTDATNKKGGVPFTNPEPKLTAKDPNADYNSYLKRLEGEIEKTRQLTTVEKLLQDQRTGTLVLNAQQAIAQEKILMAKAKEIDETKVAMQVATQRAELRRKDDEESIKAIREIEAADEKDANAIKTSLMTKAQLELQTHEKEMQRLNRFHDTKLENIIQANAAIEQENARHSQAIVDMQVAEDRLKIDMVQSSAGQLYDLLKQAGLQQTALGKIAFLATKALAVAQIILNTNVAAAAAMALPPIGLGPIAGMPYAAFIRAMGYASAGMTAGLAIAEASAEGGYDIPSGKNPITQLHEKEMVLPRAQADVIRGLAGNGGGALKLTIINKTASPIGSVTERINSAGERELTIEAAVSAVAARMSDPNSQVSRAMGRNYAVQRSR